MIISRVRHDDHYQKRLFLTPLGGHGHRRIVIGNLIEELTAAVLGGHRHTTVGEYCPDVSVGDIYLECKAMGLSKQSLIYKGRLEKDHAFSQSHRLFYCVWSHRASTLEARSVEELEMLVLRNLEWGAIIPFEPLYQYCKGVPPTKLNTKYGKSDSHPAYGEGYRVPKAFIEPFALIEYHIDNRLF